MKIIVCDDEPAIRQQIQTLIHIRYPDATVLSMESADALLKNPNADLIMLDIQMDNVNGIEAARRLRAEGMNRPIIFITAIKDYIFDAYDLDAFWYLLKPIEKDQFYHVLDKAIKAIENAANKNEEVLVFETKKQKYSVAISQILYAESIGKKIVLHTYNGLIEIYGSMRDMEEKLGDGFVRSHRGYLVNMSKISSYSSEGITLSNGDVVYLARDRYRAFIDSYMRYLKAEH